MIGITSINGYPRAMKERFSFIRQAGFGSLLLWWDPDEDADRPERIRLANQQGLFIENVHASTDGLNNLWLEGEAGTSTLQELIREVEDCARLGIKTMVLHLTNGSSPPPVTAVGIGRVEALMEYAENKRIRLAFENVRLPIHLRYILDHYKSPYIGLCYDSGHEHFWSPGTDWLSLYPERVFAVHLSDNAGDRDSHLIPLDGSIHWPELMQKLKKTSYNGTLTLETEIHPGGYYEKDGLECFLKRAYESGLVLQRFME